ncbi:hypothetical protein, partial [Leptospira gomenensis]
VAYVHAHSNTATDRIQSSASRHQRYFGRVLRTALAAPVKLLCSTFETLHFPKANNLTTP